MKEMLVLPQILEPNFAAFTDAMLSSIKHLFNRPKFAKQVALALVIKVFSLEVL